MKNLRWFWVLGVFLIAGAPHLSAESPAQPPSGVLENLLSMYEEEVNIRSEYLAYSQRAEDEGYSGIASLFRAVSRSEEIHAKNHLKAIKKLGKDPSVVIHAFPVNTTRQNLDTAGRIEHIEGKRLYPDFIRQTQDKNIMEPAQSYEWAKRSEIQHAALFKQALESLGSESWRWQKTFFVCRVCGYTDDHLPKRWCPVCNEDRGFETVA